MVQSMFTTMEHLESSLYRLAQPESKEPISDPEEFNCKSTVLRLHLSIVYVQVDTVTSVFLLLHSSSSALVSTWMSQQSSSLQAVIM